MDASITTARRCAARSWRSSLAAFVAVTACIAAPAPARAIPIFAQRYHLSCETCHSVLPELNAFGRRFREHGYVLPIPRHGTTLVALRYQLEFEQSPAAGSRRFTPAGVILSNALIGRISAFVHYNLGAGGGPGGLYLGYLAGYDAHTRTLYRAGLFELPLAQSPGQRLDDLAPYGYYGTHVGLDDLALSAPRWGVQLERRIGASRLDAVADLGEYKGSAYGGAPVPTGETTSAAAPEIALFARTPLTRELEIGASGIVGERRIAAAGKPAFDDGYRRYGALLRARHGPLRLQAEQWWGSDANADGFGTRLGSSGGYVRLKYYPTPHAYLGIRYDAAANPYVLRDMVYYAAFMVTPHARLILQSVRTIGPGPPGGFSAALTVGAPWPKNL